MSLTQEDNLNKLQDNLSNIQQLLNYHFKNLNLLIQAFTRRSYKEEHKFSKPIDDNEVLEFVGDRALDLIITKLLTNKFTISEYDPTWIIFKQQYLKDKPKEALFTEIKEDLVRSESLSKIITNLKLNDYLLMGKGDYHQQVNDDDAVKEDLFEAIIGAVTIDSNYNLPIIEQAVRRLINLDEYFNNYHQQTINYISLIKEWANKKQIALPDFDNWLCENINNQWNYHNEIDYNIPTIGIKHFSINNKHNKQEARYELAKQIYDCLQANHLINQKEKIVIDLNKNPISQVNELVQEKIILPPIYKQSGETVNKKWYCVLFAADQKEFTGIGNTKGEAKKDACLKYLEYLSSNN